MARWQLLCLLFLWLDLASADQSAQPEDSTLPAVNFKFEFPSVDKEAGGKKAKHAAELAAFAERGQHLLDATDRDSEASAAFAAAAHDELDALAGLFQKISSFRA